MSDLPLCDFREGKASEYDPTGQTEAIKEKRGGLGNAGAVLRTVKIDSRSCVAAPMIVRATPPTDPLTRQEPNELLPSGLSWIRGNSEVIRGE